MITWEQRNKLIDGCYELKEKMESAKSEEEFQNCRQLLIESAGSYRSKSGEFTPRNPHPPEDAEANRSHVEAVANTIAEADTLFRYALKASFDPDEELGS